MICNLPYDADATLAQLIAARAEGPRELRLRLGRRRGFGDEADWIAVRRDDAAADLVAVPPYRIERMVRLLAYAGIQHVRVLLETEPDRLFDKALAAALELGIAIERVAERRSIASPA